MNKEIDYNLAKLCNEKGFDIECISFYTKPNSKMFGIDEHGRTYPMKNTPKKLYHCGQHAALYNNNVYFAPTIADLVMWLYEKHGIWIGVTQINEKELNFFSKITINSLTEDETVDGQKWSLHNTEFINVGTFNTPTEAYLKAIEYTLTSLI